MKRETYEKQKAFAGEKKASMSRRLMLSPWEHHNERRPLTAAQCTQMNLMALEICE